MGPLEVMQAAFIDELTKIAVKGKFLRGLSHRVGRRPMRVSTMLKREKDGELFKTTKAAGDGSIPYSNSDPQTSTGANGPTGTPATLPKVQGEVPSREDGREAAATKIPSGSRTVMA